jgi:hypothetical protein
VDPDRQLDDLTRERAELYARLAALGDFRRGTVSETYRRCGKPNCVCATEGHPGHGPRMMWTRKQGAKTVGRQLRPDEVDRVRAQIASWRRFVELTGEIVEVNEAICESRPAQAPAGEGVPGGGRAAGPEKGGGASPRR